MSTAPTPADIRAAREAAGLSLTQAARLAGLAHRARWAEYEAGTRSPSAAVWELFLLRVEQHPTHVLRER